MGYDLHISRRADWVDDGSDITVAEWLAYLDASPDMRLDGYAEAVTDAGDTVRVESPGLAVWTGYSKHGLGGNQARFLHSGGQIIVKNPDAELRRKMFSIARHFGARVQGDDGEFYDELGNVVEREQDSSPPRPAPWWKFWR